MRRDSPFLQSLKVDGREIPLGRVINYSYIESLDLSYPGVIIEIRDVDSFIRDDMGLKKGSIIETEMGDVNGVGDRFFSERFVVGPFPIKNGVITVEAFQESVHRLKQPAVRPIYFANKTPAQVLKRLLPELRVECSINTLGTYHLDVGGSASRLLRSMERDLGAAIWVNRGVVHCHKLDRVMEAKPLLKMGLNTQQAEAVITTHRRVNDQAIFERQQKKQYCSWSIDKGISRSNTNADRAPVMLSYPQSQQLLDNQSLYVQTVMEFETVGNSDFAPSVMLDFELIKLSATGEIDESIGSKLTIEKVTHFEQAEKYLNLIFVGELNG